MGYKINLGVWNSVFAVPCCVVDEHIKMAGSAQLKALLYLLRHSGEDVNQEEMSKALSIAPADINDALLFWSETGVLTRNDDIFSPSEQDIHEKAVPAMSVAVEKTEVKEKKTLTASEPKRPTSEECASLLTQSQELQYLVTEAQNAMGKLISRGDTEILISLHEYAGMPVDVIIMAIYYCISLGKKNMRYIERTVLEWEKNDIDSTEKADRYLSELSKRQSAWNKVRKSFGIAERKPSSKESDFCNTWVNIWCFSDDIIKLAYDICIDNGKNLSFPYINKILQNWHEQGIKNINDAYEASKNPAPAKKKKNQQSTGATYEMSDIEKLLDTEFMDGLE